MWSRWRPFLERHGPTKPGSSAKLMPRMMGFKITRNLLRCPFRDCERCRGTGTHFLLFSGAVRAVQPGPRGELPPQDYDVRAPGVADFSLALEWVHAKGVPVRSQSVVVGERRGFSTGFTLDLGGGDRRLAGMAWKGGYLPVSSIAITVTGPVRAESARHNNSRVCMVFGLWSGNFSSEETVQRNWLETRLDGTAVRMMKVGILCDR